LKLKVVLIYLNVISMEGVLAKDMNFELQGHCTATNENLNVLRQYEEEALKRAVMPVKGQSFKPSISVLGAFVP
jgi:hypothetical protein